MERAINEQVLRHLESNKLIHDWQYGFRQHRSTIDILAYVTHVWNKTLEAGNETLAVALDILKAFDMVWHKNLIAKLTSVGLAPKLCKLFESFISDRSIKVVINGISSYSLHTNAGVPQ